MKTIEWPKNPKECLKFTDDGGLAIIGERKNYKDAISIISLRPVFIMLPELSLGCHCPIRCECRFFQNCQKRMDTR